MRNQDSLTRHVAVAAGTTLIAVRSLEKSHGTTRVLRGVNLTVRAGEIHARLGGNGAGERTVSLHP